MGVRNRERETHSIARPSNESTPPLRRPNRPFSTEKRYFLLSQPSLLTQYQCTRHSTTNELAGGTTAEERVEGDAAEGTADVEDVSFGGVEGVDGDATYRETG
jgi:hypothetical protein